MPSAQRPKVRIVERRTPSRAATISLVIAAATAAAGFAFWRFWHNEEVVEPQRRTLHDAELDWRCEGGHLFQSHGQIDPRPCWKCGQLAYPVTRYVCPSHGSFEVAVRFAEGPQGIGVPTQLRLPGGTWVAAEEGLKCPRCRKPLTRESPNALARLDEQLPAKDSRLSGSP